MEDIKEKTADEMFEELGYEKMETSTEIVYEVEEIFIIFDKREKRVGFIEKRKYIDRYLAFKMELLQAINKKCKELGWI